jgi:hypothetical protein
MHTLQKARPPDAITAKGKNARDVLTSRADSVSAPDDHKLRIEPKSHSTPTAQTEIGCQVTSRKVNAGTRSDFGRDCQDAFLGLARTAPKPEAGSGTTSDRFVVAGTHSALVESHLRTARMPQLPRLLPNL